MDRITSKATKRRVVIAGVTAMLWLAACAESADPVDSQPAASDSTIGDTTKPSGHTEPPGTPPTSTGTTGTLVTEQTDEENEGGFGAPAAAPGEFEAASEVAITAIATLDNSGCWYLTGDVIQSLLVAPEGTVVDASGSALVTPTGEVVGDGDRVDARGWLLTVSDLPGGPDGKWANYVAFCDPSDDAVVTTSLGAAFDPVTEDPAAYAAVLSAKGAALFDTDYGCGYGFTAGDRVGTWALRIDTEQFFDPPAPRPVTLPDDRFEPTVTAGGHLFSNHCDDVEDWFEPDPAPVAEWPIVAGSFTYPDFDPSENCASPATIVLAGGVVDVDGTNVALDDITITNDAFGCFAG